ncbi:unnamed protein product [Blepharisma stoltei]|uniref:MI domain-containing protein n=1 Tax=Blepharisma stoltei TaxID=1481888 RepID=A0AAU9IKB0_9CILI|nr:unnamed protein product [Blepharisma stoltei]
MSKDANGHQWNFKAEEFTPFSFKVPSSYSLNPQASAFVPDGFQMDLPAQVETPAPPAIEIPKEEPKITIEQPQEETKTKQKVYTLSFLMSLRENCKILSPNIKIPDPYNPFSKNSNKRGSRNKGKTANFGQRDTGFQRNESVFTSCSILVKAENSFVDKLKKEVGDIEKMARKIRGILNKLARDNMEKLGSSLAEEFEYNYELLHELVKFIFERATALSFPDLYADLCGFLRKKFKEKDAELSNGFRIKLVEKCRECFYNEDKPLEADALMDAEYKRRRRLIGNIKFIGLLYKQRMIKADIMFECFNVLLKEDTICDETIETSCHLFRECAPLLALRKAEQLLECYNTLSSFRADMRFSKRIQFMIQDIIDKHEKLMTPEKQAKSLNSSPVKEVKSPVKGKGVKFAFEEEDKETSKETAGPAPTILKKSISQDFKDTLRGTTKAFLLDRDIAAALEKFEMILQQNADSQRQMLHIILKYVLSEYGKDGEFEAICDVILRLIEHSNGKVDGSIFETSIYMTIEVINDIRLDSPNASNYLRHIIIYSKKIGIELDQDALIKHLDEYLSRKLTD